MNGQDNENEGQEIDLGDNEEQNETPAQEGAEQAPAQPSYPSVMLSGGSNLMKIPDKGKMMVKHKVIARHLPSKFNKKHRVEVELHSVHPQKMRKGGGTKFGKASSDDNAAAIKSQMDNVKD